MRAIFLALTLLFMRTQGYCLADKKPPCEPLSRFAPSSPFVIDHYIRDSVLRLTWAIVIDCGHPHWPPRIREVPSVANAASPVPNPPVEMASERLPRIQRGSRVELWSEGPPAIRLSGVALGSAFLGQQIRVRAGLGVNPLCGIVSGPHSAELIGNDKKCQREP